MRYIVGGFYLFCLQLLLMWCVSYSCIKTHSSAHTASNSGQNATYSANFIFGFWFFKDILLNKTFLKTFYQILAIFFYLAKFCSTSGMLHFEKASKRSKNEEKPCSICLPKPGARVSGSTRISNTSLKSHSSAVYFYIYIAKETIKKRLTYAVPIQRHHYKPLCINSNNSLQFCFLFWQVPLWLLPWLQQCWIRQVCRLNNLWTELIICIYPCVNQS